jgi:hypothetical protein
LQLEVKLPGCFASSPASLTAGAVAAPLILSGRYRVFGDSPNAYSDRCIRLLQSSIVVDLLNQFRFRIIRRTPLMDQFKTLRWATPKFDLLNAHFRWRLSK